MEYARVTPTHVSSDVNPKAIERFLLIPDTVLYTEILCSTIPGFVDVFVHTVDRRFPVHDCVAAKTANELFLLQAIGGGSDW